MNLPSLATLQTHLKVDRLGAVKIRKAMEKVQEVSPIESDYLHRRIHEALKVADEVLGTHGVEGFTGEGGGLSYCNAGDTYAVTLIFDWKHFRFVVGCWGDIVEREPKRFP